MSTREETGVRGQETGASWEAAPSVALPGHSLLAVFAHPDDESLSCGGLLAWCAALGVHVSLLCLSHGEHGQAVGTERPATPGQLREVRATELGDAAAALGIAEVSLLDYEDGMLPWLDTDRLETDIRDTVRRVHPEVLITFGEDGLYWHPDHIAVHERTTAVVAALDDEAPALFYVTMPAGAMRAVVDHAADVSAARDTALPSPRSILGVVDVDAFGADAPVPTLAVHAGTYAAHKLRALNCHRSQLRDCALTLVEEEDAPRLLGTEHYRRADVGARGAAFIERFRCT